MQSSEKVLNRLDEILNYMPQVVIDPASRFKYIYMAVYLKPIKNSKVSYSANDTIYFVRGSKKHSFHVEIYEEFSKELTNLKLKMEVLNENKEKTLKTVKSLVKIEVYGGGWMEWEGKKLQIGGESVKYGPANHERTMKVLLDNMKELKPEDVMITDFY